MKAAILEKINEPLVIGDVDPMDLQVGQVLVKILVSGICGSQLHEIAGNKGNAKFVPHLLGHEGCGIVEEIGPGVSTVKRGNKVVMHWRKGDGIESDFPSYKYKDKLIKSGKVTTFSQYSIVSENRITAVPFETNTDFCALLGCGLSTALGIIDNETDLKMGESFLVIGLGGLGMNLVRVARIAGAYPIIAIDIQENKREIAESMGVDLFINSKEQNVLDEIHKKFGIKNIDIIVDSSGNKYALENSIGLLSGFGRYIMLGHPKPNESIELLNAVHMFEGEGKILKATQGGRFVPHVDIPRYIRLFNSGILKIDDVISHRVKLDDINKAIDLVRQGRAGRILIDM
ncbi:MAG: zinc-binding dehydrogenase [Patescibacteria group bacterium]